MTEAKTYELSKAETEGIIALQHERKRGAGSSRQRGRARAFREGGRISLAPYGYTLKDRRLEPNQHAETVRRLFGLRAEGAGYQEIADCLNEAGIPSPLGKSWKGGVLKTMLGNEVYRGRTVYQPWGADDPIVLETPWTRIVDTEVFDHVQERMATPLARRPVPAPRCDRRLAARDGLPDRNDDRRTTTDD